MGKRGTELAKAYVQIIPSAEGMAGRLSQVMNGEAGAAGSSAGSILGGNLGKTLVKAIASLGLGKVLKDTLLAGADLEQSLGGVETLFKDHANKVVENAKKAYATAGMSANEYMETVTGFSASLLQGVGGNTELAASIADRALIDMADNVNKMGSSMEMIQNAYQGFAKQNYTMLDNLKLGYGGTQEEMKRLISDASKMKDVQEELGITVDSSSMSFDNIINAISVMQSSMGIAGATANEAKTTFSGSFSAMKAAAQNFMTTLTTGEDMGPTLTALFETIETFAMDNLIPMVGRVFTSLGTLITENGPQMISSGSETLTNFINGITSKIPDLVPEALKTIVTLADAFIKNFPKIVSAGINLLKSLVQGIINALPTLIAEGPRIINDFSSAIFNALGTLITTGLEMMVSLIKGLWDNRGLLLENAGEIFTAFLNVFSLSKLLSLGKGLIGKIVEGIKAVASNPVQAVKDIFANVVNAIKNINWLELGKNIISGIVAGITGNANEVNTSLTTVAKNSVVNTQRAYQIKSPSRVFKNDIGRMLDLGLARGITENAYEVTKAMDALTHDTLGVAKTSLNYNASVNSAVVTESNDAMLYRLASVEASIREVTEILSAGFDIDWDDRNLGRLVRKYA